MIFGVFFLMAALFFGGCSSTAELEFFREESKEVSTVDGVRDELTEEVKYDRYFLCDGYRYHYQTLTPAEKIWYTDMENILGSMWEKGELSQEGIVQGLSEKNIDHIFQCVMMDHPELFYVDGYVYGVNSIGDKPFRYEFSGTYHDTRQEAVRKKAEIESAVSRLVLLAPAGDDDYYKIKFVYETLIRDTDYDLEAPDNQNIYSVFVGRLSVCQGYAKATQYLLNRLGVECTLVSGVVQGGNRHGWNLVHSNGEYYYLDTTWGDASYKLSEEHEFMITPEISYDFLCVTTDELSRTHRLDETLELPLCNSIEDNYYVREGAYFTEYREEQIKALFQNARAEDYYQVTLKCADIFVYDSMKEALLEQGKVFQFYEEPTGNVVYVKNDEQYSLTFWVTNS